MRLYLMQHGRATLEEHDPARPLTEKGRADTQRVVQHAVHRAGVRVGRIIHSGKLRARQTAEIWAEYLPGVAIVEADNLDPTASPEIWRQRLASETDDVLLVGHLPHLARLATLIICGPEAHEVIRFQYAGLVCLDKTEQGGWSVRWTFTPEIV